MWLWLSSAIVRLRLALPRFVNVAEPVASPQIQSVGSEVAVVLTVKFPEPSTEVEPVTAPQTHSVLAVAQALAVSALPVTAPVTGAHTLANVTVSDVPTACPMLIPLPSTVTPVPASAVKVVPVKLRPLPAS